ncbi:MAG: hypothetical protein P1S46_02495 [bacterium]|nr:hypothetical protein [bacterium]
MNQRDNLGIAIFLVSLSVLLYELTLTRLFSVLMWYHFASLSIAAALLGFAIGGVVVHVRPSTVSEKRFPGSLAPWTVAAGLSTMAPFLLLWAARLKPGILFPLLSFFHQPYYQPFRQAPPGPDSAVILSMAVLYAVITVPFTAAGIALAGLFMRVAKRRVAKLYAADLAGAAAGCLLFVPGLKLLGAPSLLPLASASALAASFFLVKRTRRLVILGVAVLLVGTAIYNGPADRIVRMPYARGQLEPDIRFSAWNALSRVVVYPLSQWEAEQAWGIGRRYTGRHPEHMGLLVDDAGYTPIMENTGGDPRPQWATWHIISPAFQLRPGASSLIIGPGGGRDILTALGSGASRVTAVELNPLIVEAVNERFRDFSGGPYSLPGVRTIIGEGRSRLARETDLFDVIQATSVFGENSPSAGAFTLSANFLYTKEAFREYWDHLEKDGILSLTRSVFGLRALRLVSLARDLLVDKGDPSPENSIAVLRERGLATVLLRKGGFTEKEIQALGSIALEKGFTIEYLPRIATEGRFADAVRGQDITGGRFDISPPTDDRPFFYNNVPKSRFFNVFFKPTERGERHIIVLRTMAVGLLFPIALLLLLPLLGKKPAASRQRFPLARTSAYFAGIGFGYMTIELTMMHRLALFLGNPTYSLTVVLVVLLLSSAAGSLWSGRGVRRLGRYLPLLSLASILLSIVTWAVCGALSPSLDLGTGWRILVTTVLLSPQGFVMGIFFPTGLVWVSERAGNLVPWAWAVNGATSVAGSLGTVILAMNFGYSRVLVAGALCYALTFPLLRAMAGKGEAARKEVDL